MRLELLRSMDLMYIHGATYFTFSSRTEGKRLLPGQREMSSEDTAFISELENNLPLVKTAF